MQGLAIGVGIAALVIGAYVLGGEMVEEQTDGPAEKIGEAIDRGVNDVKDAADDAAN